MGIGIFASSTIGNGTATGGLTIDGGATTTGNAYFAGNIGVGTTSPSARLSITGTGGSATNLLTIASSTSLTSFAVLSSGDVEVSNNFIKAGITWTSRSHAATLQWGSVTYGNGLFVAVASNGTGNQVMTSPDGINWTSRSSAADNAWTAVTYGNGLFVAVSASAATSTGVMTSPDGISWTAHASAEANYWSAITYGNGLFVAVSYDGTKRVMVSPDGVSWRGVDPGISTSWYTVTYGNGLFVMIAGDGTIMTSPDGINWTSRTSPQNSQWYSVTYGNGLFVAVSYDGTSRVMTSPNGTTWTLRSAAAANQWTSVTYGAGLFVAVSTNGTGNRVMTSPDGISWTSRSSAASNQWRSVTYGNGLFVATANVGSSVMTSGKAEDSAFAHNNIYQGGMSVLGGAFNIGTTTPTTSPLYGLNVLNVASTSGSSLFTITNNGNVGIGTSTPGALLNLDRRSLTGSVVGGMKQYLSFANSTVSAVYYGDESYFVNAPTATSTFVGKMIRIEDTSVLGNTVRGLEVQAHRGTNTSGENTALSGFARTFGVSGTTFGDAGETYLPAGVFAESQGTTQGNALRAYSGTLTTEDLVSFFHDTSNFTGTGLSMNFGNAGGTFTSTSTAKFLDFKVGGTSKFTVTAQGTTTIGDGTTTYKAGLQIGYGGLCVDNDGSCTASTTGRITSVSSASGNSDLAEMYFSSQSLEAGEIVALTGGLSMERADEESAQNIIGVVSTKPGVIMGFDDTSLIAGEGAYPVALKGRVPIKLSTENGPITKGDRIALSSIAGVGMKANDGDVVVGIALEDYTGGYAYSPAYLNQFGDDLVKRKMRPLNQETDARTQDGCSYGGGSAQGEAQCVKDRVKPIKPVTVSVDTKTDALNELKAESAKIAYTKDGEEVTIGQAIMFVHLHDFIAQSGRDILTELSATSSVLNGNGTETLWDRIKTLATNFVGGVLTVVEVVADTFTANKVDTNMLCVGETCVDEETLKALLQNSGQTSTQSQPVNESTVATSPDTASVSTTTESQVSSVVDTTNTSTSTEAQTEVVVSEPVVIEPVSTTEAVVDPVLTDPLVTAPPPPPSEISVEPVPVAELAPTNEPAV